MMALKTSLLTCFALLLTLAACGGGGSSQAVTPPTPPLPPANSSPVFTSLATHSTPENIVTTGYSASATDADGDTLSYSITGGPDGSLFSLTASSGLLQFLQAPDFESPADSNSDNIYIVAIRVSDGRGGTADLSLGVTVTDVPDTGTARYRDLVFGNVSTQTNVAFGQADAAIGGQTSNPVTLRMNIYTPTGDSATDRPVLVMAFGGGFVGGSKLNANIVEIATDFARRGYVVAAPDYRLLSAQPANNDEMSVAMVRVAHDINAAIRFFREDAATTNTYGVNGNTIFVGGISSGAVGAILSGTLDAGDTLPSAMNSYLNSNGGIAGNSSSNTQFSSQPSAIFSVSGGIHDLNWIGTNSVPIYMAHEEFDTVVPCKTGVSSAFSNVTLALSGSCDMEPVFQGANLPTGLFIALGSSQHTKYSDAERTQIRDEAAAFLYAQLP